MIKEYIYFRESLFQSIAADVCTFSLLLVSLWFNYQFIGGSKFVNAVVLIMFLMSVSSKVSSKVKRFTNKEALIKYLQSDTKDDKGSNDCIR